MTEIPKSEWDCRLQGKARFQIGYSSKHALAILHKARRTPAFRSTKAVGHKVTSGIATIGRSVEIKLRFRSDLLMQSSLGRFDIEQPLVPNGRPSHRNGQVLSQFAHSGGRKTQKSQADIGKAAWDLFFSPLCSGRIIGNSSLTKIWPIRESQATIHQGSGRIDAPLSRCLVSAR